MVSATPAITSVVDAAGFGGTIAPNSFVTIFGRGFTNAPQGWSPSTSLPTSLGGVKVQIDGKDCYVSFAGFGQLNVLTPPDLSTGLVSVTVTTGTGSATVQTTVAPIEPAWFTYSVNGATWLAALIANTSTLVAPAGFTGAGCCQPAKAGAYLQLYAQGLGPTNPVAPAGVVLTQVYPVATLSQVKVTIGGRDAQVLFAGLVSAGLYQVNVQVPEGVNGDLAIGLTVAGESAKSAMLSFQQ